MPSREVMNLYNEDVRFATSKFTDWTDQQTVTIASDPTVPSTPTLVANAADQAIDLVITAPTTNTDGSAIVDLKDYTVYYSTSSGIDTTNPSTYSGTFNTASTRHTFATDAKHYFKVVCNDKWSNSGAGSNEASATPTTANGTVDVDDYTDNIETIVVGDGMIGIKFQLPKTSWQRWAAWKLYAEDDAGSGGLPGTPTWDLIYNGSGPGFIYKGLNTAWIYEFKLTVLGEDGTETTGTISDNSGAGYQPNGSDNDNLVAIDIFAENIVATNEVRGNNISSSTTITAGSGNNVGVLDGADATYRIYAGNSDPALAPFRVTQTGVLTAAGANISGTVTITGGSGIGNLTDAGALATLDTIGASDCDTTIISGGKIITGLLTASNIQTGTLDASVVSVTNLNASNITTGTLSASKIYGGTLDFGAISRNGLAIISSEIGSGAVTYGKIAANAVRANELYIDDDINFAANGSYHSIDNIDAIYFRSTSNYPGIWYYSSGLKMESASGGDILMQNYLGSASFIIRSGGGVVLRCGSDNIEFIDAATTGGQWNLGYINVKINGVSRSIAIENPH